MTQPIGTINVVNGELYSLEVSKPNDIVLVGNVETIDELKIYTVASEKTFADTSVALNSIYLRIDRTQRGNITFEEALNIYLDSIDHFIRVHKSEKQNSENV